ncbi:MAG: fimbrial assembly protein [Terracidiphilus sp.]|nr:fimbrial assembly protein [Terracidiphilus sp.]
MRIGVNLATRPFLNLAPALKRLRITIGVLALAAIALGAGLYAIDAQARAVRAKEQAIDAQITRIERERSGYQARMRQPANAAVLTEASNLNQLFDTKAFSWTLAMEDLETVLPAGVQVTTLEPSRDDKDGLITLHVRVLGPRDRAVDLVRNLEHSHRFLRPRIVGETAEATGGPNQRVEPVSASSRVNFDVLADYNPATAAERLAARHAAGKPLAEMTAAHKGGTAR